MKIELQERMIRKGHLELETFTRKRRHYELVCFLFGMTIFITFLVFKDGNFDFSQKSDKILFGLISIITLITLYFYYSQRKRLKFQRIHTNRTKRENYDLSKQVFKQLAWSIKVDNKGFIQGFNTAGSGFRTWGDEMISVLITDNLVMVNSIPNLETERTQAFFTFGANKKNVYEFIEVFSLLEPYYK